MDHDRNSGLAHSSLAAARWASLGFGTLLLVAPGIGTATGLGVDQRFVRAAGIDDLGLGLGLLLGGQPARWMIGRVVGNAIIGAVCLRALRAGGPLRGRSIGMLAAMAGLSVVDGLTARQLLRNE